jgi:putative sterol carrier protein
MTIRELFTAMPQYANASAIQGIEKTIQFKVTGKDAGNYYLTIQNGEATVDEGEADNPDATINTPSDVWLNIATGKQNGAVAFMMGKFKATGDPSLLISMQNWFNIPS